MKYDAFISYRHAPLDMEIARKLHKALETYHIPRAVQKKTGKKKINRVFRDQEELPIGSDLNDNISAALKEAEYLIVICSPDTPESDWVLKEIETFIEMHDREHVLAILIDGEPRTSFPAPLLTDASGNPVEPLAADIRSAGAKERNRKFHSEFLRLAAPLIGCTYDDLRQRHKERIIKRNITIGAIAAGAVAIFGAAFGTYNAVTAAKMKKLADEKAELANEKTLLAGEIFREFQQKQINQSRFYAEKSEALLKAGKRKDAIMVAMAALPGEDTDRPFVSEAEYALSNALYAYDNGDVYRFDQMITHEYNVNQFFLNTGQDMMITVDSGNTISVFDTKDMNRLCSFTIEREDDGFRKTILSASADKDAVYVLCDHIFYKYSFSGEILSTFNVKDIAFRAGIFRTDLSQAAVSDAGNLFLFDLKTFQPTLEIANDLESNYSPDLAFSPEANRICAGHYGGENGTEFSLVDTETGSLSHFKSPCYSVFEIFFTENQNIAILSGDGDFFVKEVSTETVELYSADGAAKWSTDLKTNIIISLSIYNLIGSHSYQEDGQTKNEIVVSAQYDSAVINEDTGEILNQFALPGQVTGMYLYPNSSLAYLAFSNGEITPVDTTTGQFYSSYAISSGIVISSMDVSRVNDLFILQEHNSPYIYTMKRKPASDLTPLPDLEESALYTATEPDGRYYILKDWNHYIFYDTDGNPLERWELDPAEYVRSYSFVDGTFVAATNLGVNYIDPLKHTKEKITYAELGIEAQIFSPNAHLEENNPYGLIYGNGAICLLDIVERKPVTSLTTDLSIQYAAVSRDGSHIYCTDDNGEIKAFKTSDLSGEALPAGLSAKKTVVQSSTITVSRDGSYWAVLCSDNMVRILRTANNPVIAELPVYSDTTLFMAFAEDNKTFLLQGDDKRVFFYDLTENKYVNTLPTDIAISSCIFDGEDSLSALTDGNDLYLLSSEDYGLLAYVPHAFTFIKGEKLFILKERTSVSKLHYKNYTELIAEAKEQFDDLTLSEEKKMQYNIN